MVIQSKKLSSEDFEGDPLLMSACCTVQYVEKYPDSKYTQLVKRPNDELKFFFSNKKFQCLETKYLVKCSVKPKPRTSTNTNTRTDD